MTKRRMALRLGSRIASYGLNGGYNAESATPAATSRGSLWGLSFLSCLNFFSGVACLTLTLHAAADDYPARAIRLIVPSPPGGPSDFAARLISPKLGEYLKQNVVVDNRPSVNGIVACELLAKSVPDGLTLGIGNNGTHVINVGLYKNLPYDPIRDFAPISQLIANGSVIAANLKFTPRTLKDFVAYAKANPGKVNLGVAGANGAIGSEIFKAALGLKLNNVPYKGSSPAEVAVISGEVEVVQMSIPAVAPHYKGGRLKVYGVMTAKRSPLLPDIPTLAEQGFPGFENSGNWHGLLAPANTPASIVHLLQRDLVRLFDTPDIREVIANRGSDLIVSTPEQFAETLKRDIPRYRKLMLDAGITPQ